MSTKRVLVFGYYLWRHVTSFRSWRTFVVHSSFSEFSVNAVINQVSKKHFSDAKLRKCQLRTKGNDGDYCSLFPSVVVSLSICELYYAIIYSLACKVRWETRNDKHLKPNLTVIMGHCD